MRLREVVALGEAVQRLAGDVILRDLPLELDAVGTVLGHGLSSSESPACLVNPESAI
jgi:hypothetical protein